MQRRPDSALFNKLPRHSTPRYRDSPLKECPHNSSGTQASCTPAISEQHCGHEHPPPPRARRLCRQSAPHAAAPACTNGGDRNQVHGRFVHVHAPLHTADHGVPVQVIREGGYKSGVDCSMDTIKASRWWYKQQTGNEGDGQSFW